MVFAPWSGWPSLRRGQSRRRSGAGQCTTRCCCVKWARLVYAPPPRQFSASYIAGLFPSAGTRQKNPICSVRIRDDISRRIECSFFLRGGYHERLGGRHRPDAFIIDIFCADCQQYLETELFPTGSIEAAVRTVQGELGNKRGYCDGLAAGPRWARMVTVRFPNESNRQLQTCMGWGLSGGQFLLRSRLYRGIRSLNLVFCPADQLKSLHHGLQLLLVQQIRH